MKYRKLGNSGMLVSELALGTMIFGEKSERSTPPAEAKDIIHRFLFAGGNHIDTANVYADGRSEEIVGEAIKGQRDQVVLATKVRFSMGEGPNDQGLSRYHIINGVEGSLRRLQVDTIDLLYMHCWDSATPIEESLRAFNDLVTAGKVRYIGVSNFKAWQLMKALGVSDTNGWARFIAAQYQYSLVVRDIEHEFTDLCLKEGVGITPWGPLGGGFLAGKYQRDSPPEKPSEGRLATTPADSEEAWHRRAKERNWLILAAMDEIAETHGGISHSQIAIAWLLAQPAVDSVIIGVRTMDQLNDNLGAVELSLSAEEITKLNEVSMVEPGYPYRFIQNFNTRL
ncbi:MAG: aldo/keto reductase [Anaerolineales bacterium]|jgi:aryl-alcohol dehydrogenase-like predicted oxidoreductase